MEIKKPFHTVGISLSQLERGISIGIWIWSRTPPERVWLVALIKDLQFVFVWELVKKEEMLSVIILVPKVKGFADFRDQWEKEEF